MTGHPSVIDPAVAKAIELVGFDVDGVLTDAGVYVGVVGGDAVELKRFDIQDGVAIDLLRDIDIKVALVSGRSSRATTVRGAELEIADVVQDDRACKLPAFEGLLAREGVSFAHAAFVGDDLPDLPLLRRVGLPVAVANAVRDVKEIAGYVTVNPGGRGAVREFVEMFLRARGDWERVVDRYLAKRGDPEPWRSVVR